VSDPSSHGDKSIGREGGSVISSVHRQGDSGSVAGPPSVSNHSAGGSAVHHASTRLSRRVVTENLRLAKAEADSDRLKNQNSAEVSSVRDVPVSRDGLETRISPLMITEPVTESIPAANNSTQNSSLKNLDSNEFRRSSQVVPLPLSATATESISRLSGLVLCPVPGSPILSRPIPPSEGKSEDEYRVAELPRRKGAVRRTLSPGLAAIPSHDGSELESSNNSQIASQKIRKSPANRTRSPRPIGDITTAGPRYHCLVVDDSGMSRKVSEFNPTLCY
jgi:hypothetical protein